ncbi:hypothetical protein JCM8547_001870 [Rhodosporidiobolus lusitaniae]
MILVRHTYLITYTYALTRRLANGWFKPEESTFAFDWRPVHLFKPSLPGFPVGHRGRGPRDPYNHPHAAQEARDIEAASDALCMEARRGTWLGRMSSGPTRMEEEEEKGPIVCFGCCRTWPEMPEKEGKEEKFLFCSRCLPLKRHIVCCSRYLDCQVWHFKDGGHKSVCGRAGCGTVPSPTFTTHSAPSPQVPHAFRLQRDHLRSSNDYIVQYILPNPKPHDAYVILCLAGDRTEVIRMMNEPLAGLLLPGHEKDDRALISFAVRLMEGASARPEGCTDAALARQVMRDLESTAKEDNTLPCINSLATLLTKATRTNRLFLTSSRFTMSTKRRLPSPEAETESFSPYVYPQAGPTPKKPKRGEAGYGEPEPEKRQKLFKKSCSKATQERANRVFTQRFFCVHRQRTSEISEEFKVLGSTGNQYTVTVDHRPKCDCPDGAKGNKCKHQLFVLLKILQVPQTSNLWYQAALLISELQAIFAHARPAPSTLLDERVKKAYRIATGEEKPDVLSSASDGGVVKKRVPQEGDSCPICYEDFTPGSEAGLVCCLGLQGCGNALHNQCFAEWAKTTQPVTCPLCREKWSSAAAALSQAGPSYSPEGYANFSAQAGISNKRDTSSYYRGPQRGKRWNGGWGRYGEDDYGWDE